MGETIMNHMLQANENCGIQDGKWSVQNGIIMSIFYLCITIMSAISDTIGVLLFMFAPSSRRSSTAYNPSPSLLSC